MRLYLLGGYIAVVRTMFGNLPQRAKLDRQVTSSAGNGVFVRYGHQVVVFNNELYLLGGTYGGAGAFKNDVWKSADGQNWTG